MFSFYPDRVQPKRNAWREVAGNVSERLLLIARPPAKLGKVFAQRSVQPPMVRAHFATVMSLEVVDVH